MHVNLHTCWHNCFMPFLLFILFVDLQYKEQWYNTILRKDKQLFFLFKVKQYKCVPIKAGGKMKRTSLRTPTQRKHKKIRVHTPTPRKSKKILFSAGDEGRSLPKETEHARTLTKYSKGTYIHKVIIWNHTGTSS